MRYKWVTSVQKSLNAKNYLKNCQSFIGWWTLSQAKGVGICWDMSKHDCYYNKSGARCLFHVLKFRFCSWISFPCSGVILNHKSLRVVRFIAVIYDEVLHEIESVYQPECCDTWICRQKVRQLRGRYCSWDGHRKRKQPISVRSSSCHCICAIVHVSTGETLGFHTE